MRISLFVISTSVGNLVHFMYREIVKNGVQDGAWWWSVP